VIKEKKPKDGSVEEECDALSSEKEDVSIVEWDATTTAVCRRPTTR